MTTSAACGASLPAAAAAAKERRWPAAAATQRSCPAPTVAVAGIAAAAKLRSCCMAAAPLLQGRGAAAAASAAAAGTARTCSTVSNAHAIGGKSTAHRRSQAAQTRASGQRRLGPPAARPAAPGPWQAACSWPPACRQGGGEAVGGARGAFSVQVACCACRALASAAAGLPFGASHPRQAVIAIGRGGAAPRHLFVPHSPQATRSLAA